MHTLQRYILKELARVLLLIICVVTVLLVFYGVFHQVSESGLGPLQVIQILPYVVPSMLPFTIPATLLLAVCVVYGRLSADHEVTAAKAAGINVLSLLFPAFFLGMFLTVFSLLLSDQVIPWSMAKIQNIVTSAMEDIFFDVLASQDRIEDPNYGVLITVSGVDREQRRLIRPVIRYAPRGGHPVIVQADEATLRFDLARQEAVLALTQAHVAAHGRITMRIRDREFAFPLTIGGSEIHPRHQSLENIEQTIVGLRQSREESADQIAIATAFALARGNFGEFHQKRFRTFQAWSVRDESLTNKHQTELHNRFALSCSCFFFALLGGPFAIVQATRQFLTTFFYCFLPILLVYYPVMLLMMNFSKTGDVNPAWAMWSGNVLLLIASAFVLRKAIQH